MSLLCLAQGVCKGTFASKNAFKLLLLIRLLKICVRINLIDIWTKIGYNIKYWFIYTREPLLPYGFKYIQKALKSRATLDASGHGCTHLQKKKEVLVLDKTEFSEFAQALSVFYQRDKDLIEFTRDLFAHIYKGSIEGTDAYVHDMEPRTLKGYIYHEHDITTTAKKISGALDIGSFAEYLKLDADDSVMGLCDAFRATCPDIDESTYEIVLAERFQTIIENAAAPKRKKALPAKKADKANDIDYYTEKYDVSLVAEEQSICPNDGCTNSLFMRVGGQIAPNYEVVVIDYSKPVTGEDNLIAMCPDCAKKYKLAADPAKIRRMQEIKKLFIDIADRQEIVSQQKVVEDVRRVLTKIPALPYPKGVDLNYEPAQLKQKISPDSPDLLAQVKVWVNLYYPDVHETLQELNREGKQRFEPFCHQVRLNYLNLNEKGYSQRQIYEAMIKWLQDATNEDAHACEIVIAYFVQKCEVFDVIS